MLGRRNILSPGEKGLFEKPLFLSAVVALTVLAALGMNGYFLPDFHDNITYYYGAKSIQEDGTYLFFGRPIADWPPVFPAMLAAAFAVAGSSVVVAKILCLFLAIGTLFVFARVLIREDRPLPLMSAAILALLPTSLLMATRIASDWPFILFTGLCFLSLQKLNENRRGLWWLAAGVALGLAALTRQTGILLGFAVVAQAILCFARGRGKPFLARVTSVWPEVLTGVVAALIWGAWMVYLFVAFGDAAESTGNYESEGIGLFQYVDVLHTVRSLSDLLFQVPTVLGRLNVTGLTAISALALAALSPALLGVAIRWRRGGFRPSDAYVIATVLLILSYKWKESRYFLPVAPFLISDWLLGIQTVFEKVAAWVKQVSLRNGLVPAVGLWLVLCLAFDGYAIAFGNGNATHRGLSPLASRGPDEFYRAEWLELWELCEKIDRESPEPGTVACSGFYLRYATAFLDRKVTDYVTEPSRESRFVIRSKWDEVKIPSPEYPDLVLERETPTFELWRRPETEPGLSGIHFSESQAAP